MMEAPLIRVVDDDESVRASLVYMLQMEGFEVVTYESAEEFLRADRASRPGVLILDVKMHSMDGLKLQDELIARKHPCPIVFLSGHGDISMAVRTVKKGAVNFLQKPINPQELVDVINECLKLQTQMGPTFRQMQEIVDSLTPRERQVIGLLLDGLTNADIAARLGLSIRTVEHHRETAYRKIGVRSLPDLQKSAGHYKRLFKD